MKRWGDKAYYSIDYYLKETYKEKVYRLSLNPGLSCPNRDGSLGRGGCIFCSAGGSGDFAGASNSDSTTEKTGSHNPVSALPSITEQLTDQKAIMRKKSKCNKFIAYFQAYSNTYGPVPYLRKIFMEAILDPEVVILSIATRPDCFSPEIYDLLEELNQIKPIWIELGLQTSKPETAEDIRRGYTLSCFEECLEHLHALNIPVITHIILGLPGESKQDMLNTISYVADRGIWGIKLQLLHVLKGTELGRRYQEEAFPLFDLNDYCSFIVDIIEQLPEDMTIHRITGDGPKNLLIAPLWSTDKKRVLNTIMHMFKIRDTWQGKMLK